MLTIQKPQTLGTVLIEQGLLRQEQLNQALADAGVNLSGLISGPDSITLTSTNDGAGQGKLLKLPAAFEEG